MYVCVRGGSVACVERCQCVKPCQALNTQTLGPRALWQTPKALGPCARHLKLSPHADTVLHVRIKVSERGRDTGFNLEEETGEAGLGGLKQKSVDAYNTGRGCIQHRSRLGGSKNRSRGSGQDHAQRGSHRQFPPRLRRRRTTAQGRTHTPRIPAMVSAVLVQAPSKPPPQPCISDTRVCFNTRDWHMKLIQSKEKPCKFTCVLAAQHL